MKIQRKTEALRQASQGMRNFVEFFVKEIRNGRIDYGVSGGTALQPTKSPCPNPPAIASNTFGQSTYGAMGGAGPTYQADTRLPLINLSNEQECLFWAKDNGSGGIKEVESAADITSGAAIYLGLAKINVAGYEKINPPNMKVDYVRFYVRPMCDPYTTTCPNGGLPERQPFVTIVMRFNLTLGTGERVIIPYQTTITTDDYAIPRT